MALTTTKYEADSGEIHPIRLTSARATVAGPAPAGAVNNSASVKISKSRREFGIRPRGVNLVRTIGTAPNQFKRYSFLPCLTPTRYDALNVGSEVTVGGLEWQVSTKVPEDND